MQKESIKLQFQKRHCGQNKIKKSEAAAVAAALAAASVVKRNQKQYHHHCQTAGNKN